MKTLTITRAATLCIIAAVTITDLAPGPMRTQSVAHAQGQALYTITDLGTLLAWAHAEHLDA